MATFVVTTLPLTTTEVEAEAWDYTEDGAWQFFRENAKGAMLITHWFFRPISVIRKEDAE